MHLKCILFLDSQQTIADLKKQGLNIEVTSITERANSNSPDKYRQKQAMLKTYFSQLKRQQLQQLYDKFEIDFLMFDYQPEPYFRHVSAWSAISIPVCMPETAIFCKCWRNKIKIAKYIIILIKIYYTVLMIVGGAEYFVDLILLSGTSSIIINSFN